MQTDKYYVLNIKHRKDSKADSNKIYDTLSSVKHLNIPFLPLKSNISTTNNSFESSDDSTKATNLQVALPTSVDHMTVFNMVKTVNDELDVTLIGQQSKNALRFAANPEDHGTDCFVLGEKYKSLGE